MRKWMLLAVGAGLAAAQEPPKPLPEPPKAEEKAGQEKKAEEKNATAEAPKKFEAPNPSLRQNWPPKTPVQPNRPCAIPLLNVLKPLPGTPTLKPDPMVIVPKGPPHPLKEDVAVPAPSCDDVNKDETKK